jgi:hypothetical protein
LSRHRPAHRSIPADEGFCKRNALSAGEKVCVRYGQARKKQVMQFYDAIKNWRRIKPHLSDADFNRILVEDFNKFTYRRWRKRFPAESRPYPRSFESCDWQMKCEGTTPNFNADSQ